MVPLRTCVYMYTYFFMDDYRLSPTVLLLCVFECPLLTAFWTYIYVHRKRKEK